MAERGVTILVTTHYMDEAEFCDRLVLIYQGRLIAQGTPPDLKAEMPEEIIAVFPDRLTEAVQVLKKLPLVTKVAMFGAGLHVVATSAPEAELVLHQALNAQGITIRSMQRIAPSLEDAFISLIERAAS
jgi:ABC-2 type transport system ATP-binding protein